MDDVADGEWSAPVRRSLDGRIREVAHCGKLTR
jgi:hypothetical protein